jgi:hypothetical protein
LNDVLLSGKQRNQEVESFEKTQFTKIIIQDIDPTKIENRLIGLIPQLTNKPTKDNIKPEIIKMTPGNYFPTNV